MNLTGKKLRLSRFKQPSHRAGIIVPMDHGLTIGPVEGLESVDRISSWIRHPAIDGVILHKGLAERLGSRGLLDGLGLMIHLNGMSAIAPAPDRKELLTSIGSAMRLGADAISIQINFDGSNDAHNLMTLGSVVDEAQSYGLPVLTMLYDKVDSGDRVTRLRHLMRICIELGTDAIKLAPPAALADIPRILEGMADLSSIYFAGGSIMPDTDLLSLLRTSMTHGGAGLCVGRNVFGRSSPASILEELGRTVAGRLSSVQAAAAAR